ncbi:MAG: hypothetical protein ACRD3V_00875 [Vicinamibacteria bacterium]
MIAIVPILILAGASQAASPLSLFTYSRDSAAGFTDELLDVFRRELGKHVESFTEVAYSREQALVSVQFLGAGDLEVELGSEEEPVKYVWRGDENAGRMWALVRIGRFSKEFSVEGSGARDLSRLAKGVSDWIRTNSVAIRESRTP